MVTFENTLSKRECFILTALATDNDTKTKQRAAALLAWSNGSSNREIAQAAEMQVRRVKKLIRAFAQRRLEVFPHVKVELASRGIAGTTCVDTLLQRYGGDHVHSRYVAKVALQLFDSTANIHQVPVHYRRLLETAALLHAIGRNSTRTYNAQASEIVLSHSLDGYSAVERDMLACLVRFQEKKSRVNCAPILNEIDEVRQNATRALAAILRIADGLDDSLTQSTSIDTIRVNGSVEVETQGLCAKSDAKRANRQSDLWEKETRVAFQVRAKPCDKTQAEVFVPVVLNSFEPIAVAGRKILRAEFTQLESLARGVLKNGTGNQIQKLRRTTQRTRTALRELAPYYPRKRTRGLGKSLGTLSDALGRVRDLDVMLQDVQAYNDEQSSERQTQTEQLTSDLAARRADAYQELVKFLAGAAYKELSAQLENLVESAVESDTPLVGAVVPALIWRRYGDVRQFASAFDAEYGHELHDLRRMTKRLCYTLGLFCTSTLDAPEQITKPLAVLKKRFGQLHDAEVSIRTLQELYANQFHSSGHNKIEDADSKLLFNYFHTCQSRRQELAATIDKSFQIILDAPFRSALADLTAQF